MTRIKCLGWYEHRQMLVVRNYGGWVVEGDWNLYQALSDATCAIDQKHDGSHKTAPRVLRKLTVDEFVKAFSN